MDGWYVDGWRGRGSTFPLEPVTPETHPAVVRADPTRPGASRAHPVMRGLFALLGEQDATVQAYKQQLAVL